MARKTPTGERIASLIEDAIDLLGRGHLRIVTPEAQHALTLKLREMRVLLIAEAKVRGIDEPWLSEWWLDIERARSGITRVRW